MRVNFATLDPGVCADEDGRLSALIFMFRVARSVESVELLLLDSSHPKSSKFRGLGKRSAGRIGERFKRAAAHEPSNNSNHANPSHNIIARPFTTRSENSKNEVVSAPGDRRCPILSLRYGYRDRAGSNAAVEEQFANVTVL